MKLVPMHKDTTSISVPETVVKAYEEKGWKAAGDPYLPDGGTSGKGLDGKATDDKPVPKAKPVAVPKPPTK